MKEETRNEIAAIILQNEVDKNETARMLLEAIKDDCHTYGELKQRTRDLIKTIRFDNRASIADRFEYLVENEMNDLPLTDRSK